MSVTVRLPKQLRNLHDVPDRHTVPAGTVAEVITALDTDFPGIAHGLVDGGRLRRHIIVFVAGTQGDLSTPVPDGNEMTVVAAVAGG